MFFNQWYIDIFLRFNPVDTCSDCIVFLYMNMIYLFILFLMSKLFPFLKNLFAIINNSVIGLLGDMCKYSMVDSRQ